MKTHFVSNERASSRMFKSNLVEALSKVHFSVPLFIYVPVIGYFIVVALTFPATSTLTILVSCLGGLVFWTLTEYTLHRFVFHYEPSSKWGRRIHFIFHGIHHDFPNDALRLVMPPSVSIPLSTGFYFLFTFVMPPAYVPGFFATFMAGYLFYDISHYALHHKQFKSAFWKKLKHHHMLHHYTDASRGYGVSSVLWDWIFRTNFKTTGDLALRQTRTGWHTVFVGILISITYLLISFLLVGYNSDQLVLVGIFFSLYVVSVPTRKFILGFSIFIVFWVIFDYMKAFPNYLVNEVHIHDLYTAERSLFGIREQGLLLTPGEYWTKHSTTWADVLSGIFYLCWVPVPLAFAAFLFFRNREQFLYFSLTFLLTNLIGFVIYYLYPAAPPWYVQEFGLAFDPNTPGNTAGLIRFDHFFGVNLFQRMYAKSSNVFAAMPSLHSAYPMLVLYYGLKNKLGWINLFFGVVMIGIWSAAVYSGHHYFLDVLAGITVAVIALVTFRLLLKWKRFDGLINAYRKVIA